MLTWPNATTTLPAEEWLKSAPLMEGSWWPAWQRWLVAHSSARQQPARALPTRAGTGAGGAAPAALEDAPGSYVRA